MISAFERLVVRDAASIEGRPRPPWQNLRFEERQALESLASDTNIIICEADKGGAIVVMDREVYINEALRQLNNQDYYQEIFTDPSKTIMKLIHTVMLEASNLGYISETTFKSLVKHEYRIPVFYTLPKIHKPGSPPPPG